MTSRKKDTKVNQMKPTLEKILASLAKLYANQEHVKIQYITETGVKRATK